MKQTLFLVAAAVGLLLSGCAATPTQPAAAPSSKSAVASTSTPSATATASPYVGDATSLYSVTDGSDAEVSWVSPSKNIACAIVESGSFAGLWGCTVTDHTWVAPNSQPGDICYNNSGEDCGSGVQAIGAGKLQGRNEYVFASQRFLSGQTPTSGVIRALAYGHSVTADGITCASLETGMTCANATSGHGFTLSKSTYTTH